MVKKIIILNIFTVLVFSILCTKLDLVEGNNDSNISANISWIRDSVKVHPDDVDSIKITLSSSYLNEDKVKKFKFDDKSGSFKNIPMNITIDIMVEGLDTSGVVIYSGLIKDIEVHSKNIKVLIEANIVSPICPENFNVDIKSSNTIILSWDDISSNEMGFIIYRSTNSGPFDSLTFLSKNITNYSDTGLTANTDYEYRIYAINSAGFSLTFCESGKVKTLAVNTNSIPYFTINVKNNFIFDTISVGSEYKKSISAIDEDGDSLIYSANSKLIIINDSILWIPELADTGLQNLWIKVVDTSKNGDSINWNIFVKKLPDAIIKNDKGMILIESKDKVFQMGNEKVEHLKYFVSFTYSYWICSTEVTQGSYKSLMGDSVYGYSSFNEYSNKWNNEFGIGSNYPAYDINWYDAVLYCNALSKSDNKDTIYRYSNIDGDAGNGCTLNDLEIELALNGYRLPTEAEWEYACKAGTNTEFYWGDDTSAFIVEKYVWYDTNTTCEVATKLPNNYCLYDMSGNVYEWCNDWYGEYSINNNIDPTGPESGNFRILRGGGWGGPNPLPLSSSGRYQQTPDFRNAGIGFRVVLPVN